MLGWKQGQPLHSTAHWDLSILLKSLCTSQGPWHGCTPMSFFAGSFWQSEDVSLPHTLLFPALVFGMCCWGGSKTTHCIQNIIETHLTYQKDWAVVQGPWHYCTSCHSWLRMPGNQRMCCYHIISCRLAGLWMCCWGGIKATHCIPQLIETHLTHQKDCAALQRPWHGCTSCHSWLGAPENLKDYELPSSALGLECVVEVEAMQPIAFLSLLRLIGHIKRIVQHSQGALSWLHLIPFLAVSARQSEDVFLPHKLLSPALGLECVL